MKEQSNLNQPKYSKVNQKSYQKKEGNWQKWKKVSPVSTHPREDRPSSSLPKKEKKPPYFILNQTKVIDLGLKYLTRFTASEKAFRHFLKRKIKEYQRLEKAYLSAQLIENQSQEQAQSLSDNEGIEKAHLIEGLRFIENIKKKQQDQASTQALHISPKTRGIDDIDDETLNEDEDIEEFDDINENEQLDMGDEKQAQIDQWIDGAVAKAYQIQALNDEYYALSLLKQLRNQGQSPLQIKQKMQLKGLLPNQIEQAYLQLNLIKEEQADESIDDALYACLRYAQKKRYSPFVEVKDFELRQKQLSALARRGFSYDIAKKTMALDLEEAERLIALGRI